MKLCAFTALPRSIYTTYSINQTSIPYTLTLWVKTRSLRRNSRLLLETLSSFAIKEFNYASQYTILMLYKKESNFKSSTHWPRWHQCIELLVKNSIVVKQQRNVLVLKRCWIAVVGKTFQICMSIYAQFPHFPWVPSLPSLSLSALPTRRHVRIAFAIPSMRIVYAFAHSAWLISKATHTIRSRQQW